MDDFPKALVIASQEEVFHNNNVLYRLVRPLRDGSGVQSTDKLVNVVPFRRVYTFYHKQELLDFEQLLLARPLVLQPILHFGRGFGNYCGACYNDEPWIVMLNQTHPKILGRFQMGLDLAKQAIERGQSVEMKFCLTKLIQRVYEEHLRQKEEEEAKGFKEQLLTSTRFSEWEHADLVIRYHGYEAKCRTKRERKYHKTFHKHWDFDDIGSHEILWNQVGDQHFPYPHNACVSEDELRAVLPSWTINAVSPLQDYGYDLPTQNYSYAHAGKLYESFRKKKRQRPQHSTIDEDPAERNAYEFGDTDQHSPVAIEHNFGAREDDQNRSFSRARRACMESQGEDFNQQQDYYNSGRTTHSKEPYMNSQSGASYSTSRYHNVDIAETSHSQSENRQPVSSFGREKGHVDANVLIQPSQNSHLNPGGHLPHNHYMNTSAIRKQDSDRSRGSTNADSGFGDEQRSRGSSYDYNDPTRSQPITKPVVQALNRMHQYPDEGLVNPGFSLDDSQEDALDRHKKLVAKMLAEENSGRNNNTVHNSHVSNGQWESTPYSHYENGDARSNVSFGRDQQKDRTAESFI